MALFLIMPAGSPRWVNYHKEVRGRTDKLDAVGNTTAAIGKGFAIGSAALTALALFRCIHDCTAEINSINIANPQVMAGLAARWYAAFPLLFSSRWDAVGRAAMDMIQEVRRQFASIFPELKAALEVMKQNNGDKPMEEWSDADKQDLCGC